MKPQLIALAIGSLFVVGALAGVAIYALSDDGADDPLADADSHAGADTSHFLGGHAGDGEHNGAPGMERPSFPEATGSVPSASAAQSLEEVRRLVIKADDEFTPANGVRSGNGTLDDPYIITGYYVTGDLFIADTEKCVVVRENYIGGQLTLNWNGQCVHAHHNYVGDLRVNENVKRTGYATGGLLEMNKIQFIGQLRHYDGEFRHNEVGPFTQQDIFDPIQETVPWMFGTDPRVANVDGFNQGIIHHNTFYGSVDLDLHGHHHGTGFFAPHSHYHGSDESAGMPHDHTQRWTSVAFTDNLVVDLEGYGVRYEDRNHAGDDRTANSEDEETLDDDHRHFTHIVLARNVIEGGQIWVDVFNADDKLHYDVNPGWLEVTDNEVHFQARTQDDLLGLPFFGPGTDWTTAIHVETAKELELLMTGNLVTFTEAEESSSGGVLSPLDDVDLWPFDDQEEIRYTGITLRGIQTAELDLRDNVIDGYYYGIAAYQFDEDVAWTVSDNQFGDAQYPVYYDESVASEPKGTDA